MHLKQLKLAGFKSFVDPTIMPFSSQLVAVVGPNGCGKSNIIDAVRWVMGENSAKSLRGESMADVIFNGSSTRSSVGQASVEMVFDNSMGRLVGPYASYQEIAVRRLVTRDGDSHYYLNGARCRRRDITDIFLGTGAGARGYSIIGQETISRLIEARPEDLRAYLDEAAGISIYKERRRETMQRIQHTQENLSRVLDIRDELGKQLQRIERQAQVAVRYQSLKQDERLCESEILALKWRLLTTEQAQLNQAIGQLTLQREQHQTQMTRLMKNETHLKEELQGIQDAFQSTQVMFYELNSEMARLEARIQQQQREKQRLLSELQDIQTDSEAASQQLQTNQALLVSSEHVLAHWQEVREALQEDLRDHQQAIDNHEPQKMVWDREWQTLQTAFHQMQKDATTEQVRLRHLENHLQQAELRLLKTQKEQEQLLVDSLTQEISALDREHADFVSQQSLDKDNYQKAMQLSVDLRQQLVLIEQQLHHVKDHMHNLVTEHAALKASQDSDLRRQETKISSVFPEWEILPRLAEVIRVPEKWMHASELVLGERLQAIVLDSLTQFFQVSPELKEGNFLLVEATKKSNDPPPYPRLSDQLSGVIPCSIPELDSVFAAETLTEAMSWLPTLQSHQSVVTIDGWWLGKGWVRVRLTSDTNVTGLLLRQHSLESLGEKLKSEQSSLKILQATRDSIHAQLSESEEKSQILKRMLLASDDLLRESDATLHKKRQTLEHLLLKKATLTDEEAALSLEIEDVALQKFQAEEKCREVAQKITQHEQQMNQLMIAKATWEEALMVSRQTADKVKGLLHQAELHCNSSVFTLQKLQESIARDTLSLERLSRRFAEIQNGDVELEGQLRVDTALLNEKIMMHRQLEEVLASQRQHVDNIQSQLNEIERGRKEAEHQANLIQENIQQERLLEQGLVVQIKGVIESLTRLDGEIDVLLAGIPDGVSLEGREEALKAISGKIARLGAINLVAIEEYQTELQRKQHLDEQYLDLTDALETLKAAIVKMDQETQLRLKDTFLQVNTAFQTLFPRLFGGGRAQLELTCDNLLEAGILVMAQPPGKRNSSIHSLSGGEKAMTAVALVFAIFQQNPSPFCMLDEVDAPLDDLNVRRFCDLVKEMSNFVQFLFITHNKTTMELADHLIGVTMREPGVSRIVAVDVEEALAIVK